MTTSVSQVFAPIVISSIPASTVAPSTVVAGSVVNAPTVLRGAVVIQVGALSPSGQVFAPIVSAGNAAGTIE